MKTCIACGMPLDDEKLIGAKMTDGFACIHCSNPDGSVKSCEDIFEGGVDFFMGAIEGADRDLAEKLVRKNMNMLPYWQENKSECLDGEEATEEEFADAMSKL